MKPQIIAMALFAVFAQSALAANTKAPANAATRDDFSRVAGSIRSEMAPKGRYAEVAGVERSRVEARLDEMAKLFAKSSEVAGMTQSDKVALFNAQEEVNGILLKRDGDRLVCVTEARSGTHLKNTNCKTAREIAADRDGAQNWYRNGVMHGGVQCSIPVLPGAFAEPVGTQSCRGASN